MKACCLSYGALGAGVAGVLTLVVVALPLLGADVAEVLKPATDFSEPEPFERHPGGATTQKEVHGRNAFSQPAANLSFEERADFFVGNGLFKRLWVTRTLLDPGGRRAGAALQRPLLPALPPQGRPRPSARWP